MPLNFKTTLFKSGWCYQGRSRDGWNRIKFINKPTYTLSVDFSFRPGAKMTQSGQNHFSGARAIGYPTED